MDQEYSTGGDKSVLHSITTDFPYGAYLVLTDGKAESDGFAINIKNILLAIEPYHLTIETYLTIIIIIKNMIWEHLLELQRAK